MTSSTYKNEIMKRKFYEHLEDSKRFSEKTIECYEKAIWQWEDFSHKADFGSFNKTTAKAFKTFLKTRKKANSQDNLSLSYCYDILRHLKTFFEWLSKQSGYKLKIKENAIDCLNLSKKEAQEATQPKGKRIPAIDEVKTTIEAITGKTEVEMRDKALISLALLTGARISSLMTLPMESFDKKNLVIHQDPALGVATKFSNKFTSSLISFSYKEPTNYFIEWFDYLEKQRKFKANNPIFPATKAERRKGNVSFCNSEKVEPIFWKSSSSAREIFKKRFEQAGIKYYNPHSFRHLLVKEMSKIPLTEEQKKAVSQSLGHKDVGTTFGSYGYGNIPQDRQIEIISDIDLEGKKQEVRFNLSIEEIKELINNDKK